MENIIHEKQKWKIDERMCEGKMKKEKRKKKKRFYLQVHESFNFLSDFFFGFC